MRDIIDALGARALRSADTGSLVEYEFIDQLPPDLTSLLREVGNAVVFDRGAKFIPLKPSGREDSEGYMSIEVFYGLQSGLNGIVERNSMLDDQMPTRLIAIGEAPGGDQICLDRDSQKILFWKHDVSENVAISEVANDFVSFLRSLEPDESEGANRDRKVVKETSWLDF